MIDRAISLASYCHTVHILTLCSANHKHSMGMMIPSRDRDTPADRVRVLMAQKENLEAELDAQASILKANSSTLMSPLVDAEGFPRADIDVWAVRHARVRILELRNDLYALRDTIATALQEVFDPTASSAGTYPAPQENIEHSSTSPLHAFAKVDGVAPRSPAATAVRVTSWMCVEFAA